MQPGREKLLMPLKNSILVALLLIPALVAGADLAREKRIAEQIEDAILDGETLYLPDGDHQFLGIYTRTERSPARGAAIIVHGLGANPDWVDVVQPLRIGLPEYGWDTLSIQVPVAREGATPREQEDIVPEAMPRIDAAMDYLQQRDILNVVLVAHSHGARMAAHYLANKPGAKIQAFVAIGMSADAADQTSGNLEALQRIQVPVLDIYGELDLPQVRDTARQRRLAAQDGGSTRFRQSQIPGADHFFANHSELLLTHVRGWMNREAGGSEIPVK